jgi:hypothetical protein
MLSCNRRQYSRAFLAYIPLIPLTVARQKLEGCSMACLQSGLGFLLSSDVIKVYN